MKSGIWSFQMMKKIHYREDIKKIWKMFWDGDLKSKKQVEGLKFEPVPDIFVRRPLSHRHTLVQLVKNVP